MVIHFSKDLLFCSRVGAVADDAQVAVQTALTGSQLDTLLSSQDVEAILIDLEHPEFEPVRIAEWKEKTASLVTVAYGPHVHTDRLKAAEQAGCDVVLSRGQFDQSVKAILSRWALGENPQSTTE